MIILAAAIILSLSNSGIISKANKAKTDSDNANLKVYVNTLRAEWELMTAEERTESGAATFEDYANKKLADNGYKQRLSEDGILMNEAAAAALKEGIKVGDVVTGYTVKATTYTTSGEENTCDPDNYTETTPQPNTVTTNTSVTWKYLGINDNGEIEIIADLGTTAVAANTKVALGGKGGYLKGPEMLNIVCDKLYSVDGKGTARSMNMEDVIGILEYNGPKGKYFLDTNEIETDKPLTIGEIGNVSGSTPDGKNIETYKVDYYDIDKTNHSSRITNNTSRKDLVYQTNQYWVASHCPVVLINNGTGNVEFSIRSVNSSSVGVTNMFHSFNSSNYDTFVPRPVVTLNSNVKLTPNADKTEWAIS